VPLELIPADYSHPMWPVLAPDLATDVHSESPYRLGEPTLRLPSTDRPENKRRFMVDPSDTSRILGITSFGINTLSTGSPLFITEVFIPRPIRGNSYGTRLMELTEQTASRLYVEHILLHALERSVGFYLKMGYIVQSHTGGTGPFMIKSVSQSLSSSSSP
jgi:GNAT superfamily N-acetyltransferase